MSFRGRPICAGLVVMMALATAVPAIAQQEQVPQSLWGVRGDVGLGVVPQFVTNYGDRSALEQRPSGEDVRVAVIDTGIAPDHPDLEGSLACDHCWRDFVANRTQPYDDNGHGTHVAGIIAGDGHLQANPLESYFPTGAIGMASETELIVAKAMNETGGGSDQRVAEAIRWAMDPDGEPGTGDEPHIIHLSLGVRAHGAEDGTVATGSETEEVVREAIEQGTFVVMSAGNQDQQGPAAPGNVDGVIAVGALTAEGQPLAMSNAGEGVDVFAPGVIMSTWPTDLDQDRIQDGYTGLAGTSQAAPVVTGGLALAADANPQLREGGGATKVEHVETMVTQTGEPRREAGASFVAFDGEAFVSSQDQGTDALHWPTVIAMSLLALLTLAILGRAGFAAIQQREDREPRGEGPESRADGEIEFADASSEGER